jgi:formate-dependent nitrite reductase membrane component NrfD
MKLLLLIIFVITGLVELNRSVKVGGTFKGGRTMKISLIVFAVISGLTSLFFSINFFVPNPEAVTLASAVICSAGIGSMLLCFIIISNLKAKHAEEDFIRKMRPRE